MGTQWEWTTGPHGCENGAIKLPNNQDNYLIYDNSDGSLSYGPSMSFFIYLYHTTTYNSILEYGAPGHVYPNVLLHFNTFWGYINGLYFGLANGTPNPWYGVNNINYPNRWNHVGFTYDAETRRFKFWVNGVNVNPYKTITTLGSDAQGEEVTIGLRRGYADIGGSVSCAAFFDHALSEPDIQDLMEKCKCLECEKK
jgi:hypothetical protein